MAAFDMIIRSGTIVDGTGASLFEADIGIRDGVIADVGTITASGTEEIDAKGLIVTPGFVDIHTHYDGQATWDPRMTPSSWHGVTTAVMGNCGVGFAPVRPADHQRLIELMEGVEDIPGTALHEGLAWDWESFPDYLDALERRPRDIDLCAQLPHGALRVFVMGERGARLEPANGDDIAQMRKLTAEAARAGAIGFSTSRTLNHRTVHGDPTPSLRATEDELTGIAMGLSDAGSGVIEMISDFDTPDLEGEFAMIRRIVQTSGRPLSLSLGQRHSAPEGWRDLLGKIDEAVSDGLPILAQVAPRPIGVLLGLQASTNPFAFLPAYREIADRSFAERLSIFRENGFRTRLLAEAEAPVPRDAPPLMRQSNYRMIFPFGDPPNYEPSEDQSLFNQAAREGRSPAEIAYDLMVAEGGTGFLFSPFSNFAHFNLDACGEMIAAPNTVMGLGDGGAHVGLISDASFTTYLLSHWGRDRGHGGFDLPGLVRRQTRDTARAVGLLDRGVIAPGMKADLNLIDFDRLGVERPAMAYDLPAGGKRLLQPARGYAHTLVSGLVTYREGIPTDALPGRLVRGPQAVPIAA